MSLFVALSAEGRMSGFECLADLIIDDDGVSACDAGYGYFLCNAAIAPRPSLLRRTDLSCHSVKSADTAYPAFGDGNPRSFVRIDQTMDRSWWRLGNASCWCAS